jgi:hypothetical protein
MTRMALHGVLIAMLLPLGLVGKNAKPFSPATLKGTCIWQSVAYSTTSGDQQAIGPATILASVDFDGNGAVTIDYDVNRNGTYSSTGAIPGSYSVDSTGHGSFTFTSPSSGYELTYDFRVSPSGQVLYTIVQSYGGLIETPRVAAGSCTFH